MDPSVTLYSYLTDLAKVYLLILSTLATFGGTKIVFRAFVHLSLLLSMVWGVYIYRDVWPLATVDLSMVDASEGALLWIRVALLSFSGVFVPLFSPRNYIPMHPEVRAHITEG